MPAVLKKDDWLSDRLGKTAGRLDVDSTKPLDSAEIGALLSDAGPDAFVYCKIPCTHLEAVHRLEQAGFRMIETALTLGRPVTAGMDIPEDMEGISFACENDRDAVSRIAAGGFSCSRFHLDPLIPRATADRVKADWAANYFPGLRGDSMVVARHGGEVCGFNLLLHRNQTLVIDLIAVAPARRRRGVAGAMIAFAQKKLPGFRFIHAGTQAANLPALRLYESLGFRIRQTHYVLHFHGPAAGR